LPRPWSLTAILNFQMKLSRFLTFFFLCFYILFFIFNFTFIKQKIRDFYRWEKVEEIFLIFKKKEKSNSWKKTEKEDSLEIPSFDLILPLSIAKDEKEAQEKLREGVVLFLPESYFPVEKGKVVILGHSAPDLWPAKNYESAFSKISQLKKGDEIVLNFNQISYFFSVKEKFYLERGEEIPQKDEKGILFLISCWPPGQDLKRIAVFATLE